MRYYPTYTLVKTILYGDMSLSEYKEVFVKMLMMIWLQVMQRLYIS